MGFRTSGIGLEFIRQQLLGSRVGVQDFRFRVGVYDFRV